MMMQDAPASVHDQTSAALPALGSLPFDIGPLSWVAGEIHVSLMQAHEALQQAHAQSGEAGAAALARARASLHQVHGALRMLELDGVDLLSAALENLLAQIANGQRPLDAALLQIFGQSCQALHEYLEELHEGLAQQPLRLFPYYQELLTASGISQVFAVDLFNAGFRLQLQPLSDPAATPAMVSESRLERVGALQALRQRFEKALLHYLKQPAQAHASIMRDVIAAVETQEAGQPHHAFWWVMHGFADAVATQQLDHGVGTKHLFGRINMQLQRLSKDAFSGNSSVLNEALFQLACTTSPAPLQSAIRAAYRLDGLVPVNFEQKRYCRIDLEALRISRSQLARLKNLWGRIAQGEADLASQFAQDLVRLATSCQKFDSRPLADLLAQLSQIAPHVASGEGNEALSLEIATGLLVLESGLNELHHLPEHFAQRAYAMIERLQKIDAGAPAGHALEAGFENSFSQAQQQMLHVLVEEMQSGLREVENTLDAFFRQNSQASALSALAPRLHQIEGALAILEQDGAVRAIQHTQRMVDDFAHGLLSPDAATFECLAQNVGALGLFMDALQCNPEDAKKHFFFDGGTHLCHVDDGVPVLTSLPASADALAIDPAHIDAVTPADEPLSADDLELRMIFFGEAREALGLINDALAALPGESDGVEFLISVRRYFHTLKGSSRMVGLDAFSAAAGQIEQRLDRRLAENSPPDPELLSILLAASNACTDWLNTLELGAAGVHDVGTFSAAIERASIGAATPVSASPPAPVSPGPASEASIKQIGSLQINLPLYIIYRAETEELVNLLAQEVAAWRHAPDGAASIKAVHAAHSLAGSSATVGLKPVHEIAFEIEAILQHQVRKPVRIAAYEFDMLTQAIDCISHMLGQFSASEMPASDPAMVHILQRVLHDIDSRSDAWLEHSAMLARAAPDDEPGDVVEDYPPAPTAQVLPADAFLAAHFDGSLHDSESVTVHDAHDADLLPIFIEEAQDLIPQLGQTLRDWRRNPADVALAQSLLRMAHTLKGSARMAGAMRFGQHLHHMEARIESCLQSLPVAMQVFDDLLIEHDRVVHLYEQLCAPAQYGESDSAEPSELAIPLGAAGHSAVSLAATSSFVRVRSELLDRLVNQAGEVSISRSKLEAEVGSLRQSLADLGDNVTRLREQLREIEMQAETQINSQVSPVAERVFDALEFDRFTRLQELTRMMAESVDDVVTVQQSLASSLNSASNGLLAQGRLTRALQQDLLQVRMVQFGSIADRLYRVVRQTAKELGKRVNLDIRGAGLEVDRGVLERMAGPFEHLLRNAIVHGIEREADRRAAAKSQIGELQIEIRQEGNEIVLQFSDDGAGLDLPAIRARGLALGLLADDATVTDPELMELIFNPGFSTVSLVTESAGRGIGMDAVRTAAADLGGTLAISSQAGQGMQVTIRLPLTLAVTQVVLVKLGMRTYALPSMLVEQVIELKPAAFAQACANASVIWQGQSIALHDLASLLGDGPAQSGPNSPGQAYAHIIIVRNGLLRLAVHVDDILGNREVVVKNTGPQLARVTGITGATVLGSGEIVLIINALQLAQHIKPPLPENAGEGRSPQASKTRIVMVVDDSMTVRRVTQRLLVREGYEVVLAKDGVDAMAHLQDVIPDVMLVDVEMPRMDGFDLTRNVRDAARTHAIPIIMITSRTAAKHRDFALGLGVNAYFGKPFQEADLLRAITRVLELPAGDAAAEVAAPSA